MRRRPAPLFAAAGVVLAPWLVLSPPLTAQEPHLEILRQKLQAEIVRVAAGFDGVAGIHVVDLASGERSPASRRCGRWSGSPAAPTCLP